MTKSDKQVNTSLPYKRFSIEKSLLSNTLYKMIEELFLIL